VALNEYNMRLVEDDRVNRMLESMDLLKQLIRLPQFSRTSFILFFNKADLFREKIKTIDLRLCFPDYSGSSEESALQFITQKFLHLNRNIDRQIFSHVTCATDTQNIKIVMAGVRISIMKRAIQSVGI